MKVKIRAKDIRFSMPVPTAMIGVVIRLVPERLFEEMRENTPGPYCSLLTRKKTSVCCWRNVWIL